MYMKKIILTIAALTGASLSAFSQGQLAFNNALANGYVVQSSLGHTVASSAGTYVQSTSFTAQLWALAAPTSSTTGLGIDAYGYLAPSLLVSDGFSLASGGSSVSGASGGAFSAGSQATVSGTTSANTVIAIVCWTGSATTFANALAAYNAGSIYMGILAYVNPVGPASPTPNTQDISTGWNTLQNSPRSAAADSFGGTQDLIMTQSVPEPATLTLAGLGGLASLVMLRRKKA
jgi:hypothetical protein